jgi:hypothetical protein
MLKKISKKRNKEYVNEIKDKRDNRRKIYSNGWEIAKEVKLCVSCNKEDQY